MLREMRKLLKTTGNGGKLSFLLLLRSPMDAAFTFIQARLMQRAFEAIMRNNAADLSSACIFFGVATLCVFLYNGTVWGVYAPFVTRLERTLRIKLYERISAFSYERIESAPQGEWLTLINTDVEMPFSRPLHLPHAACAIVKISMSAVILWRINPTIFGWVLLFAVPQVLLSQLLIARAMPGLNRKSLEVTAKNTDEMTALITCADISLLYDGRDYLMKRFEQSSHALLRSNMKIRARKALGDGIAPLWGLGGYLTLLIVGGGMTFGGLTAVSQYRIGVLSGASMLVNCLFAIQASMAGIKRINDTMYEE